MSKYIKIEDVISIFRDNGISLECLPVRYICCDFDCADGDYYSCWYRLFEKVSIEVQPIYVIKNQDKGENED